MSESVLGYYPLNVTQSLTCLSLYPVFQWNGYEIVVRTTDSLGNILYFTNTSKETQEFTLCVTEHNELQAGKEYFFEVRVTVPCGFGERAILRARFASVLGEYCFLSFCFFVTMPQF